jgi:NADH-quinone oxidoreductase subunit E
VLSESDRQAIAEEVRQYPSSRAACIDVLLRLQERSGWISDERLAALGEVLGMSPAELEGVATFYNRILRRPVGRHVIWICDSASCWLMGSERLRQAIERHLGIGLGETTSDGRYTLLPTVCLGACDRAPVLMLNDQLVAEVDPKRVGQVLARAILLTKAERQAVAEERARYPTGRAACVDALVRLQERRRWISDEVLTSLASLLAIDPAELEGVATFYNRILRHPVGRHVIWICDSASCWLMGYDRLRQAIEGYLGIRLGETTADSRFTLLPTVCLGACDHAPTLMIDDELHRDLEPEAIPEVLAPYD